MLAQYSTGSSSAATGSDGGAGGGASKRIAAVAQENGALAEQRQRAEHANEKKVEAVATLSAKIGKLMGAAQGETTLTEVLRQEATKAHGEVDVQREEVRAARVELRRARDQERGARVAAAKRIADASASVVQGFPAAERAEAAVAAAAAAGPHRDTTEAIAEWTTTVRQLEDYVQQHRAEESWYAFANRTFDDALATAKAADMTAAPLSRTSPDQLQALF